MPPKISKSSIIDSPFARRSIEQQSDTRQKNDATESGSQSDIEPDLISDREQLEQVESSYRQGEQDRQISEIPLGMKQEKSKYGSKIDYSMDVGQYLNRVGKSRNNCESNEKQPSLQSKDDDQIKHIINEVLNKRKKASRVSNFSDYGNQQIKDNKSNNKLHINQVNRRIQSQNLQLSRNIKNLMNKIKSLNAKNNNSTSSRNQKQLSLMDKKRQLSKLKKRLARAEETNAKMSLQLSKLYDSRRSKTKQRNNSPPKHERIPDSFNNRQLISNNTKLVTEVAGIKSPSPLRQDYYSPIMEFQDYNINNEPTISLYDRSLHKTSQFGLQAVNAQMVTKEVQTDIKDIIISKEEEQLDRIIVQLETKVRNNNNVITKYEQLLIKHVL